MSWRGAFNWLDENVSPLIPGSGKFGDGMPGVGRLLDNVDRTNNPWRDVDPRGQVAGQANAADRFADQSQKGFQQYGADAARVGSHLRGQMMGRNSLSAEQLRQGLQQNLAAQQSMAAAARPGSAPMAARMAMRNAANMGSGLAGLIYSAGIKTALPASCWRQDPANSVWYSAVRATQGSGSSITEYKTFNKTGLECLGREIGKATSWVGWIGKGCEATYSGSTTAIPYVIFRAPT